MTDDIFSQLIKKEEDKRKYKKQYALNRLTVIFQFLTLLISLIALSFSVYPLLTAQDHNVYVQKEELDDIHKEILLMKIQLLNLQKPLLKKSN